MPEVIYESSGIPLEKYQLTRSDHRDQEQSEAIERWAHRQVEKRMAQLRAAPELAERARQNAEETWKLIQSMKTRDHEIMRWRVRLYCGHITETRSHRKNGKPTLHGSSSMRCSECGKNPSVIVAFEPLGLVGQPPASRVAQAETPKRATRAELERRIAHLEAENERLRTTRPTD
ncbi:hypothetical protein [Streptomyces gobitricini]|uniref:Uncharacterized protein n=1 Tax=Streptomyces gobitricini TaxID=68211 RepID=A0ABP5ZYW4_9ACTN